MTPKTFRMWVKDKSFDSHFKKKIGCPVHDIVWGKENGFTD